MLGYRHYADDLVEYFVQKSIANGIDIIRIFDALNDIRNLETAIKAANKEKGHGAGCCLIYSWRGFHSQNITWIMLRELRKQELIQFVLRIWQHCLLLMRRQLLSRILNLSLKFLSSFILIILQD